MKRKIPIILSALLCVISLILIIISVFAIYKDKPLFEPSAGIYFLLFLFFILMILIIFMILTIILKKEKGKKNKETRFPMLSEIDFKYKDYEAPHSDNISLKELCDEFRQYSAATLGLYYTDADIRKFIAGMAVSKFLILQGMSGTGKTSLAYAFGKYLRNDSVIIPVQPMWKERTDLIGYYNEFSRKFNETVFLETLYKAQYTNDINIIILDELNIARVEYYFAEFLSLMEIPKDSRYLEVISSSVYGDPLKLDSGRLKLGDNIWFIGTLNNDDSTFSVSDKVYDRAMILNLNAKALSFATEKTNVSHVSATHFNRLANEAKKTYRLRYKLKRKLALLDDYMIEKFHISFGNRIMKQIEEYVSVYVSCGGSELEALDDILSKKIFRKLEGGSALYVKKYSQDLLLYLDSLFGNDKMPLSKEIIEGIVR